MVRSKGILIVIRGMEVEGLEFLIFLDCDFSLVIVIWSF